MAPSSTGLESPGCTQGTFWVYYLCANPQPGTLTGQVSRESGSHDLDGGGTWIPPHSKAQQTRIYTVALKVQLEKSGLLCQGMAGWDGQES